MPMSRAAMDRAIEQHFGFEARDDVAGVLATLAPDAVHDVVGWPGGPTRGRERARAFYEASFRDLAEGRFETRKRLYGENFVVDDSVWRGVAAGRPLGLQGRGRPLEFRILHVFEFADNGSIERENVWLDVSAIVRQLSQDD
jgi:uncharacterized protein